MGPPLWGVGEGERPRLEEEGRRLGRERPRLEEEGRRLERERPRLEEEGHRLERERPRLEEEHDHRREGERPRLEEEEQQFQLPVPVSAGHRFSIDPLGGRPWRGTSVRSVVSPW